ncbi:MAG: TraI domain-containing protein [Sulfuritalea sp.]|nr:TraI domain-containing protein [Sulfuritalea sp.]
MWKPLSLLLSLAGVRRTERPVPQSSEQAIPSSQAALDLPPGGTAPRAEVLRYPPYDTGFRFTSVASVIEGQKDIITRIGRTSGLSDEEFAERFEPAIHKLARYVHLLPATATAYFRGEGGLLRMSLEIGLFSLQTANASVFPIAGGVERRYYIQPKWCVAAFLAGACSQLHRAVNHMAVVSGTGQQWAALMQPLSDWATEGGYSTYFVRWLDEPHGNSGQAAGAFLVNQIVSPAVLQWLAEGNNHVLPAMASAIAGIESSHRDNPIARIVAPIVSRVIDDDMRRNSLNYGHLSVGLHLEPHIIDAMRRLINEGNWIPNHPKSPVWVGPDGTYLRWTTAAADIVAFLNRDGFAGVPQDPDTLAEILIRSAVLQRKDAATYYWTVVLPNSGDVVEGMAKLAQHDFIFPAGWVAPDSSNMVLAINERAASTKSARPPTDDSAHAARPAAPATAQIELELAGPPVAPPPSAETSNKPASPKTPRAKPKAPAKPDVPPAAESKSAPDAAAPASQAEDSTMISALKKEHAWLMSEIVAAYQNNRLTGTIHFMPTGVGISHDELAAHGQQIADFVEELSAKRWLWKDHNHQTRHLHRVTIDGVERRMIILRPDVAVNLGLVRKEPCSAS